MATETAGTGAGAYHAAAYTATYTGYSRVSGIGAAIDSNNYSGGCIYRRLRGRQGMGRRREEGLAGIVTGKGHNYEDLNLKGAVAYIERLNASERDNRAVVSTCILVYCIFNIKIVL